MAKYLDFKCYLHEWQLTGVGFSKGARGAWRSGESSTVTSGSCDVPAPRPHGEQGAAVPEPLSSDRV